MPCFCTLAPFQEHGATHVEAFSDTDDGERVVRDESSNLPDAQAKDRCGFGEIQKE